MKTKMIGIRVDDELHEKLRAAAARADRKLADWARLKLESALKAPADRVAA